MPVMFTEVWKCSEESLNKVEQIGPYWHYCLSNFNYSFSILRSPSQWNEAEDRLLVGFLAELNSTPSLVRMVQSLTVNFVKGAWKKPPRPVVWNQFVFIASINFWYMTQFILKAVKLEFAWIIVEIWVPRLPKSLHLHIHQVREVHPYLLAMPQCQSLSVSFDCLTYLLKI